MEKLFKLINEKAKNKVFTIENTNSIADGCEFKFQVIKKKQLITMGEWEDYIFISVEIISLGSDERAQVLGKYLNGIEWDNRIDVEKHAYRTAVAASAKVEAFLKHFNVKDNVMVDSLKYDLEELK